MATTIGEIIPAALVASALTVVLLVGVAGAGDAQGGNVPAGADEYAEGTLLDIVTSEHRSMRKSTASTCR